MGGASPYRARFIGLPPCGQPSRDCEGVPLGDNGEKYFGLVNTANTCYANSVLQALYFCLPFRKAAIRHLSEDDNGDSLLTSLSELFAQIDSQKRPVGCITPRRFLARLRKANDLFNTSEHQDAHEFMQFLLNDIAENLKARVLKQREREKQNGQSQPAQAASGDEDDQPEEEPRTWIHDIFQGYLVNQMKCLCCENVTVRRETFLDLSVDIERHTSIAACLRAFESTELLRSGNKFFCDMCGCLQEAEKRLRIYQLPSVLMLHLKRFKYVERLGRSCRLPYRVVFSASAQSR
jgi:ubiquitin carboxyl-terminal hydrolase 12/46